MFKFSVEQRATPSGSSAGPSNVPRTPDNRGRKRSVNDVRLNPASPDVLENLLASFSAISMPAANEPAPAGLKSAPQTPPRSIYSASTHYTKTKPRARPSEPSVVPSSPSAASVSRSEASVARDAAEPPVIRTARPPSGLSSLTSPRSSTRIQTSPYAPPPIPPKHSQISYTNQEDQLGPLPNVVSDSERQRFTQPTSARVSSESHRSAKQRDSLIVAHSRDHKGKEREASGLPVRSSSIASPTQGSLSNPTSPRFRPPPSAMAPKLGSSRISIQPSPPSSTHSQSSPATPTSPTSPVQKRSFFSSSTRSRPSGKNAGSASVPVSAQRSPERSQVGGKGERVGGENKSFVPARRSSLHQTDSRPPSIRLHSSNSARRSNDFQKDERFVAIDSKTKDPRTPPRRLFIGDMDEENDVVRRIRELKAAKEKRDQYTLVSDGSPEQAGAKKAGTISANSTPARGAATPRLRLTDSEAQTEPTVRNIEDLLTPEASVGMSSIASPSYSSLKARLGSSAAEPPPISPQRRKPSFEKSSFGGSPPTSRPGSRLRKESSELASKPSSIHRRDNSRGQNSMSFYAPVVEEGKSSMDSINDSVRAFLRSPRLSQRIVQPGDRRTVSFSEVGDPNGYVVFCCVGMGLTRYIMAFYEELAASLKLRLITPDRPGIGDSDPYTHGLQKPLHWPDDIQAICDHLSIERFSVLAHSAGAIYALATALRMPSQICGKIHLLAPWIPPSQMVLPAGKSKNDSPAGSLPRSQRFLRMIPTSFLKLSNSSLFGGMNRDSNGQRSSKSRKGDDSNMNSAMPSARPSAFPSARPSARPSFSQSTMHSPAYSPRRAPSIDRNSNYPSSPRLEEFAPIPTDQSLSAAFLSAGTETPRPHTSRTQPSRPQTPSTRAPASILTSKDSAGRLRQYDRFLTPAVWELATRKSNPAVDLVVCLERTYPIGFQYADITRSVVIHHGTKDSRVPIENVKWIAAKMQKAEVRVVEGDGHGLMASAGVMGRVLTEMAQDREKGVEASETTDTGSTPNSFGAGEPLFL